MFKKTAALCLAVLFLFPALPVSAKIIVTATVQVYLNGHPLTFDQDPFAKNDQVLAPVRAVAEAAGCTVSYDSSCQTVTLTKTDQLMSVPVHDIEPFVDGQTHTIELTIGSALAEVDGVTKLMAAPAEMIGGRVFAPLRSVANALDMDEQWQAGDSQAYLYTRMRGTGPLADEQLFPSLAKNTYSVKSGTVTVSLGMDVTEMYRMLGQPDQIDNSQAPLLMYYVYTKKGANVICLLGKVIGITLSSGSTMKTSLGISTSSGPADIAKAYGVSGAYIAAHTANDLNADGGKDIFLLYDGDALADSFAQITHCIDFAFIAGQLDSISLVDWKSLNEIIPGYLDSYTEELDSLMGQQ